MKTGPRGANHSIPSQDPKDADGNRL